MIILLNTSTTICELTIVDCDLVQEYSWQSDRGLAKGLLKFIDDKLKLNNKTWSDILAIGIFEGPGSFTGLRIGITVANTIADAQDIPIVGGQGNDWKKDIIFKLNSGIDEKIVLPFYDRGPNITVPRK